MPEDRPNRITIPTRAPAPNARESVRERRNRLRAKLKGEDYVPPTAAPVATPERNKYEELIAEPETKPVVPEPEVDENRKRYEELLSTAPDTNTAADYLQDRKVKDDPHRSRYDELLAEPTEAEKAAAPAAPVEPVQPKKSYEPPDPRTPEDETTWYDRINSVAKNIGEVAPQLYTGVREGLDQIGRTAAEFFEATTGGSVVQFTNEKGELDLEWLTREEAEAKGVQQIPGLPEGPKAETITGEVAKSVAQFTIGFIPAAKAFKGLGIASGVARSAAAGAVADLAAFDPLEERLSNLVQSVPELQNPVTEFLAANPDDTAAEGRIKNAIEGLALGGLTDVFIGGLKFIGKKRTLEAATGGGSVPAVRAVEPVDAAVPVRPASAAGDVPQPQAREAADVPTPSRAGEPEQLSLGLRDVEPARAAGDVAQPQARQATDIPGASRADSPTAAGVTPVRAAQAAEGVNAPGARQATDIPGPGRVDGPSASGVTPVRAAQAAEGVDAPGARQATDIPGPARAEGPDAPATPVRPAQAAEAPGGAKPIEPTDAQPRATLNIKRVGDEFIDPAASAPLFKVGKVEAGEKAALNINFARLETTDDVHQLIEGVAKSDAVKINEARRQVQPQEQTRELAEQLGLTEEQLLQRKVGQAFNSEQLLAARQILVESGERTEALARLAADPAASPSVQSEFRDALTTHHAIQQQVSGLTAEAGRALQAFRIPAGNKNYRNLVANENIIAAGGQKATAELAQVVLEGGVAKTAKLAGEPRGREAVYEFWINSLLSSPATHAANILGNALNIGLADTTRLAAAGIRLSKQAAKKLTPNRFLSEEAIKEQGVGFGEAGHAIYGQLAAVKEAFQLAGKTLKDDFAQELTLNYQRGGLPEGVSGLNKTETGLQPAISANAFGLERSGVAGRAADYLGSIVRAPGKALNASDVFFKVIGYRGELHALSYRQAVEEGLQGPALAARVKQLVDAPTDGIRAEAGAAAEYQTFTRPLEERGQAVQKALRSSYVGKVLVPFFKTPTNILKHVGAHSPAALVAPSFHKELLAGGARADVALAKVSVGSGLLAIGALAAINGHITGGGPAHPDLKARLRETGWQPYSVKVGDKYYSYSRLDPVSSLLGIAADAQEALSQNTDDATQSDLATAAVLAVAKNVHSKTWLKGVGELLEAINGLSSDVDRKNNSVHRYFSRLAGSVVPAGVAASARVQDPTLRETGQGWESYINTFKSRIPGLSETLPPRRNMFGEPVILGGGIGPDIASPIYISSDKENPVADEIAKQQTILRMPPKIIDGVDLTIEEYDSYVQLAAGKENPYTRETLQEALQNQFNSPAYARATDGQDGSRSLIIQSVVRDFRQKAKRAFLEANPRVAAKAAELKRKKDDALLGR